MIPTPKKFVYDKISLKFGYFVIDGYLLTFCVLKILKLYNFAYDYRKGTLTCIHMLLQKPAFTGWLYMKGSVRGSGTGCKDPEARCPVPRQSIESCLLIRKYIFMFMCAGMGGMCWE